MGKGASARQLPLSSTFFSSVTLDSAKVRAEIVNLSSPYVRATTAVFMSLWFIFSVASLFTAKYVLHKYHVNETVFSLWQFALSTIFGLLFTKVFHLHHLSALTKSQLRSIVPLSITFLIKELLKYAALSRISVNLVNTIRSLGPLFNVLIELTFLGHRPQATVLWALMPIVVGVALTSIDEIHVASISNSVLVAIFGFLAAVLSTAINNGQNIYSKILFGRERIDAVSLQIYLSAISFGIISPFTFLHLVLESVRSGRLDSAFAMPSGGLLSGLIMAGFVNFLASQLAFSTLRQISPLSYSVANTFKRVAIAVIAIFFLGERLSVVNGLGIAISIIGIVMYERKSRSLREARQYRRVGDRDSSSELQQAHAHVTSLPARQHNAGSLRQGKQNASGPDLVSLNVETEVGSKMKGENHGEAMQRHFYIDMAMPSPKTHLRSPSDIV